MKKDIRLMIISFLLYCFELTPINFIPQHDQAPKRADARAATIGHEMLRLVPAAAYSIPNSNVERLNPYAEIEPRRIDVNVDLG